MDKGISPPHTQEHFLDVEVCKISAPPSLVVKFSLFQCQLIQDRHQFDSGKLPLHGPWSGHQATFVVTKPWFPLLGNCFLHSPKKSKKPKFMGNFFVRLSGLMDRKVHLLEINTQSGKTPEGESLQITLKLQFSPVVDEGFLKTYGSPIDCVSSRLRTGDVVLLRVICDLTSRGTSFFTHSKWNHVAMAVGFEGRMCLLEALGSTGVALNTASLRFEDEIKRGSTIGIRRLILEDRMMLRKEQMVKLRNFLCDCLGKPYERQLLHLLRATTGGNTEEDTRSFFCSELVACALKEMGLLNHEKLSNNYVPGDFGRDFPLLKSALLGSATKFHKKNSHSTPELLSTFEALEIESVIETEEALLLSTQKALQEENQLGEKGLSPSLNRRGGEKVGRRRFDRRSSGCNLFDEEEIELSEQLSLKATQHFPEGGVGAIYERTTEEDEFPEISPDQQHHQQQAQEQHQQQHQHQHQHHHHQPSTTTQQPKGGSRALEKTTGFKSKSVFVKKNKKDRSPPTSPQRGDPPVFSLATPPFDAPVHQDPLLFYPEEVREAPTTPSPPSSSPKQLSIDNTREMVRAKGAHGFLHSPSSSFREPPSTSPPQSSPPKLSPTNIDNTREMVRVKGAHGFLHSPSSSFREPPSISPPRSSSPNLSPTNIDNTREMVRAKGAQGFLHSPSSSFREAPPTSPPQSSSPKLSPTNIDNTREMVRAKGAQGFLPHSPNSSFRETTSPPRRSSQKLSPTNIDNTREMVRAKGARGFLSQSTGEDEFFTGSTPLTRPQSPLSRAHSPPTPNVSIGIEDTRNMVRAKGAQGFLSCLSDEPEGLPSVSPLRALTPAHTDIDSTREMVRAKGAQGFLSTTEPTSPPQTAGSTSPPKTHQSPLLPGRSQSPRDVVNMQIQKEKRGNLTFTELPIGAPVVSSPPRALSPCYFAQRAKSGSPSGSRLSSPPLPSSHYSALPPNLSPSGIDSTREMVRAKGAQGFLSTMAAPPKGQDHTPVSPPLCDDGPQPPSRNKSLRKSLMMLAQGTKEGEFPVGSPPLSSPLRSDVEDPHHHPLEARVKGGLNSPPGDFPSSSLPPPHHHGALSPNLSPSGIDSTREMVRAKGAQGFLNATDTPSREVDHTPVSLPLSDVSHPLPPRSKSTRDVALTKSTKGESGLKKRERSELDDGRSGAKGKGVRGFLLHSQSNEVEPLPVAQKPPPLSPYFVLPIDETRDKGGRPSDQVDSPSPPRARSPEVLSDGEESLRAKRTKRFVDSGSEVFPNISKGALSPKLSARSESTRDVSKVKDRKEAISPHGSERDTQSLAKAKRGSLPKLLAGVKPKQLAYPKLEGRPLSPPGSNPNKTSHIPHPSTASSLRPSSPLSSPPFPLSSPPLSPSLSPSLPSPSFSSRPISPLSPLPSSCSSLPPLRPISPLSPSSSSPYGAPTKKEKQEGPESKRKRRMTEALPPVSSCPPVADPLSPSPKKERGPISFSQHQ